MPWRMGMGIVIFLVSACAHTGGGQQETAESEERPKNVRLARAQVSGLDGTEAQGTFNFEQMPNSMIVTYRIEGLKPRAAYQIVAQDGQDCDALVPSGATVLTKARADKDGVAENTFRTESVSLSTQPSLLDDAIVVRGAAPGKKQAANPVACGVVEPQVSKMD